MYVKLFLTSACISYGLLWLFGRIKTEQIFFFTHMIHPKEFDIINHSSSQEEIYFYLKKLTASVHYHDFNLIDSLIHVVNISVIESSMPQYSGRL